MQEEEKTQKKRNLSVKHQSPDQFVLHQMDPGFLFFYNLNAFYKQFSQPR